MEVNSIKCRKNEDIIIEYYPKNRISNDIIITVDMLKTAPVGTKWQCHSVQTDEASGDICLINIHTWEITHRDSVGVLVKHMSFVMKPLCYTNDRYKETETCVCYLI